MLKSFRLYLLIIISLFYSDIIAQDNQFSVYHYSINDGLSQNFANTIYQDSYGYIWIGTQDGLNKFDGYNFSTYRQDSNDKYSISNNYINDITGSRDSILWIITNDGLERFDYSTYHFSSVIKNKLHSNSIYSTKIKSVYEDKNRQLWLRTVDGIINYDPKKEQFLEYKQPKEKHGYISSYNYFSIIQDLKGNFWTGSKNGLVKFNQKSKKFTTFKFNKDIDKNEVFYVLIENPSKFWIGAKDGIYIFNPKTNTFTKVKSKEKIINVRTIHKDKNGIIWAGTEYGLIFLKPNENKFKTFKLENFVPNEVNVGNVIDILEDNSGILWVCTDYGIFKIDSKKKHFNLYKKDKNNTINFSSNTIYSIYYDKNTKLIWLGTRGFGLNVFNRTENTVFTYRTTNSNLTNDDIHCIVPDKKGNIWVGTSDGPFIYIKSKKDFISFSNFTHKNYNQYFSNNRISDIYFDNNTIWFSTLNGLLKYSNGKMKVFKKDVNSNSIISNDVFKLIKRKNGEIWIATLFGLSKYDEKTNTFTNYTKDNNKISGNSAITVFESSDQTLWIGTGSGLNKYIQEKDSFIFYTSKSHGFNNDFIYTISEDDMKNLWLSTNRGIIKFNPITEKVTNFSDDDNLQGYEFNIGAVYSADSISEIFWGGINGLNSIKLSTIQKNLYTPKPIITKFIKNTEKGKTEILTGNIKEIFLTHKESSFEIHFTVPEYTNPTKNKFKYKFKESGDDWIDLGTKNSINFFQLSPGDYTFLLIGANSDNSWNTNPVKLIIHISAPWWQTKIAYTSYILLFIFLLLSAFFVYNKEMRKENKILHEKEITAKKVEKQKEELSLKNQSISESMRYASRIINAMLPSKKYIKSLIPDSFTLFMSKEIVSGDFYWVDESDDKIFVAAVDCTGHGVPGAFMSIIGLDILRNTLAKGINTPSEILDELNKGVANIFKRDGFDNDLKDGMDISIIAIHKTKNIIEYAGAINQLFLIRNDHIHEYKANRFSISPINLGFGKYTNHVIEVKDNDMIYLFSDGYVDQFGGPDEKKFKYRRFRHLLLNNYHRPLDEQKGVLKRVINTWRGQLEQIDDILVMGIRIHTKDK